MNLFYGECVDYMRALPDASVDMILCDLPYGTSACKWDSVIPFEPLWEQYKRIIKYRGAIVLFGSEPFSSALRMSNLDMYKYDWKWEKPSGANFLNFKYQPAKVHEDIVVFGMAPTSYVKSGINMIYNPQSCFVLVWVLASRMKGFQGSRGMITGIVLFVHQLNRS